MERALILNFLFHEFILPSSVQVFFVNLLGSAYIYKCRFKLPIKGTQIFHIEVISLSLTMEPAVHIIAEAL